MSMLAKSLAYDLGLNKVEVNLDHPCCAIPDGKVLPPPPKENTVEERRAALACFCITSQYVYRLLLLHPYDTANTDLSVASPRS